METLPISIWMAGIPVAWVVFSTINELEFWWVGVYAFTWPFVVPVCVISALIRRGLEEILRVYVQKHARPSMDIKH